MENKSMLHLCLTRSFVAMIVVALLSGCKSSPPKAFASKVSAPRHDWVLLPMPRLMEVTGVLGEDAMLTRELSVDPERMPNAQGYEIRIRSARGQKSGIAEIMAHDEAGLFYATQTLNQIEQQSTAHGGAPECHIVDWPDFPNRGVMLDIARDKVPEMKTLYALVDMFSSWKYNQLQLYTEHTFAYKDHHVVWEDASPMTPAQIRDLDAYCKARFIQLVSNQNSFGHMNRWLRHEQYSDLAETPGGSDLCPVDPRSLELLRSMYTFMLPSFSSPLCNVGCDETWSLGKGRSKDAVEKRGIGRVYLDFLLSIHDLMTQNGKTMQFWADIINNHPDLIPELPKDLIAMEWGYEANHPFAEHGQRFHANGVRFYVVPGTSSWNSLLGRTENAIKNLRNAAENGFASGGEGFLVTDWGDGGHWQFLPVSIVPFVYGAGVSWCVESNKDIDVPNATSLYAFNDSANVMGKAAWDLGNAYTHTGRELGNNTVFYTFLLHSVERPLVEIGLDKLKQDDLRATIAYIDDVLSRLDDAKMTREDADIIKSEFRMNAALAKFACRIGIARLDAGGVATSTLPSDVRLKLAAELEPLIPEYRQLWLARNRSGGLKDSTDSFENLLSILK